MTPDPLQEAWQSQPLPAVDTDQLVREFRRGQQQFAAMIFWRDVREVGVSLLLLPVWVGMGVGIGLPWTWYLVMPGIVWIAAFMTVDRMRQRRRRALPGDPLVRGVESSLAEVEHQIWLLRNVHLVVPSAPGRPDAGVLRPHLLATVEGERLGGSHRDVLRNRRRWGRLRLDLLDQPEGRPLDS